MKPSLLIIVLVYLILPAEAQELEVADSDSLRPAIQTPDSGAALTLKQKSDTEIGLFDKFWSQLQHSNELRPDSARQMIYRFEDILFFNYTDFSDIFRHQPAFQIYDFLRAGFPRYVARLNLLPHQTSLDFDGQLLNDPVHGMFNTHLLPLDGVGQVFDSPTTRTVNSASYGYPSGLNIKSPVFNQNDPYTRIMFRQGDFGYTDLDISFARNFSKNMALYLGGINKIYEAEQNRGFQYRSAIKYRLRPNLFASSTFYMDREWVVLPNLSTYRDYRYHEFRYDFNADLYYLLNPVNGQNWHLKLGYTRIRRKNESLDRNNTFLVKPRTDQYNFGLERDLRFKKAEIITAVSAFQNQIWGNLFSRKLTDSGLNGSVQMRYKLTNRFDLISKFNVGYLYAYGINLSPLIYLSYTKSRFTLSLSGQKENRFPYRNERSLVYEQFSGNKDLDEESITTLSSHIDWYPVERWLIMAQIAYQNIAKEIRFNGASFYNGSTRKFSLLALKSNYKIYKFIFEVSGQATSAKIYLSPQKSFSAQLRYHDDWLKGAIIIDAIANFHWYDKHHTLYYNPIIERLYWDQTTTRGYDYFSFKLAVTVKSAQLFMSVDNPLSRDYNYIFGYYEFYRRVQFGFNWILWD